MGKQSQPGPGRDWSCEGTCAMPTPRLQQSVSTSTAPLSTCHAVARKSVRRDADMACYMSLDGDPTSAHFGLPWLAQLQQGLLTAGWRPVEAQRILLTRCTAWPSTFLGSVPRAELKFCKCPVRFSAWSVQTMQLMEGLLPPIATNSSSSPAHGQ